MEDAKKTGPFAEASASSARAKRRGRDERSSASHASAKASPKDVFLHIFTIAALYVSMISLTAVAFQLINVYFPDPLSFEYGRSARGALRWPLAVLTVLFPLYLWANIFLQRDAAKYPEKEELKTRKWLLYLTLFIAVLVIAGDLVSLIFRYLEGELSVRFFLKVFAVFLIAISVFLYYGWNVRREIPATKDKKMNVFVKSAVFLTLALVIFGYFVTGSPQAERQRRFDERRVSDLQQIQFQIVEFWRAKERLPDTLDELRDELRGFIPPKDPETGENYEYRAVGEISFELCVSFRTSNKEYAKELVQPLFPGELSQDLWLHDPGRNCFERTIDPEFYPPYSKEVQKVR